MTISVPSTTATANFSRWAQPTFSTRARTTAQPTPRYNGFTRNQQATPKSTPAPRAHSTLFRFAASNKAQLPASTNHIVGGSAEGDTPYKANNGESPTSKS